MNFVGFRQWAVQWMACAVLAVLATSTAQAAVPQAERDWLMALYNQTNGPGWNENTNWGTGDPCANQWQRITCVNGQITELYFRGNDLRGTVPAMPHGPGIFEKLELIDLSGVGNSRLTAAMPALRDLPALKIVRLHDTKVGVFIGIQGSLPTLTNLPLLEEFTAYDSSFSGTLPALAGLTSLATFDVRNNQLTGSIPGLSGLPSLVTFNVSNNQLTGSIPNLSGLSALVGFYANNNLLDGTINFPTLPAMLESFRINNNRLTGTVPLASTLLAAASASKLCANHLENTLSAPENDKWNHATSQTYWYENCTYIITPNPGPHGVLTPADQAEHPQPPGAQVVLTAEPDLYFLFDGFSSNCPDGMASGNDYVLNAQKNCTVTATFKRDPAAPKYTVTASTGTGGSISPAGNTQVFINDPLTLTLSPAQGYMVDQVTGTCGGTLNGNVYTTTAITQNCTVMASFKITAVFCDGFESAVSQNCVANNHFKREPDAKSTATPSAEAGTSITPMTLDSTFGIGG